jgi:prepilin-type N-terminal cleavage/methylation domain-containing protein
MTRGMTLPEMVVTLAVVGLTLSIAAPQLAAPLDAVAVEQAAGEIAAAHARARITAVVESRVTQLRVNADSLTLEVLTPGGPERRWARPGPGALLVAMAGDARTLTFAPTGISMGFSNASWTLTKGSASRRIVISRLGRVRIER